MASTRDRLLDAAETLFAAHGFASVGVRQLIEHAEAANGAAVGYHFGTKEALYAEAVERVAGPVRARQLDALAGLDAQEGADALVAAFVGPLVDVRRGPSGTSKAGLLGRDVAEQPYGSSALHELLTPFAPRLLPAAPSARDAEWQLAAALSPVALFLLDRLPRLPRERRIATVDRLVAVVVGALTPALTVE